jgi:hypothetical protein
MSPAPSATESALSPPSDVSKTESARHLNLNHLGRIEEVTMAAAVGSGVKSSASEVGGERSASRIDHR